jgi:hypothetical protein
VHTSKWQPANIGFYCQSHLEDNHDRWRAGMHSKSPKNTYLQKKMRRLDPWLEIWRLLSGVDIRYGCCIFLVANHRLHQYRCHCQMNGMVDIPNSDRQREDVILINNLGPSWIVLRPMDVTDHARSGVHSIILHPAEVRNVDLVSKDDNLRFYDLESPVCACAAW